MTGSLPLVQIYDYLETGAAKQICIMLVRLRQVMLEFKSPSFWTAKGSSVVRSYNGGRGREKEGEGEGEFWEVNGMLEGNKMAWKQM